MISIAIIDTIGLTYNGDSLSKRGLGGSESAVILMSKELQSLGFSVTVFNNCESSSQNSLYDDVTYIDLASLQQKNDYAFDVVISSRSFSPFMDEQFWNSTSNNYHPSLFSYIKRNAKLKVVWMHDTFCVHDQLLEYHVVNGHIDELFTLSDFHTSYVTNCDHGNRRMFEVLKNKIFMTRNGAVNYKPEVDFTKKHSNIFVFNASVTKGMIPLIEDIWPRIKQRIPDAKLKVLGGFYKFENGPDEQENTFWKLRNRSDNAALDIEFTGIIKQSEVAEILSTASFLLYPSIFPETFGISSLESLLYNTPIITNRFGALEETAIEQACYLIDYPVEPNNMFTKIDKQAQIEKFVDLTVKAYNDKYLYQQKSYFCNNIKHIVGWDTIALQWKQHIFKKLKLFLNIQEYRKVKQINYEVHKTFGRRFSNPEDWTQPKLSNEQEIVIVSPFYNAREYLEKCILSVAAQDYENYTHYLIDDASTDDSVNVVIEVLRSLPDSIREHFVFVKNTENKGAVFNQIETIRDLNANAIVLLLDGDDWLCNDPDIFDYYNNLFNGDVEYAYGSCWSVADNIPLIAQPYPKEVCDNKTYRDFKFNWGIPYTHLRAFRKYLTDTLSDSLFKDTDGNWFKAGGDVSTFYNIIEQADSKKVKAVPRVVYCYNDKNPLNDYKVNGETQTKNAKMSTQKRNAKFSVIVPTMWRCEKLFEKSLNRIVDHYLVGEVVIINNCVESTPNWEVLNHPKIKMLDQAYNIKVNPAWNLGVSQSSFELLCISNDDILFDAKLFDKIESHLTPENGVFGIISGDKSLGHPELTDGSIDFIQWQPNNIIYGFGQLMLLNKKNWLPIVDDLQIWFGDDYTFHSQLMKKRKNYMIANINYETSYAATSSDKSIVEGFYEKEKPLFAKWFIENPIPTEDRVKTILIAVPTAKYIEPETFKSIYDLEVPKGYKVYFQYFYGYNVDQVRNLIASWAETYDYLFSVDSDISFPKDTLRKLLTHNRDMVTGLYIQRKPGQHILEIYRNGTNVPYDSIKDQGLVEIQACGFGCVLVNSDVIRSIGYPQFVYKSAVDHKDTVSEDTYFCIKALEKGFKIFADTSIKCGHHGASTFNV